LKKLKFLNGKAPYSFKYVVMSYFVNRGIIEEDINNGARYAKNTKIIRDSCAISTAQIYVHKLLEGAASPKVNTCYL
jgi:hypothetical protein